MIRIISILPQKVLNIIHISHQVNLIDKLMSQARIIIDVLTSGNAMLSHKVNSQFQFNALSYYLVYIAFKSLPIDIGIKFH